MVQRTATPLKKFFLARATVSYAEDNKTVKATPILTSDRHRTIKDKKVEGRDERMDERVLFSLLTQFVRTGL